MIFGFSAFSFTINVWWALLARLTGAILTFFFRAGSGLFLAAALAARAGFVSPAILSARG
jgi:hypothetical protein